MLKAGIVGLPNVGKSTLFNAVTRTRKAEAANYPFCTIEPNTGIVTVPDARLEVLGKISKTQKIVPAATYERESKKTSARYLAEVADLAAKANVQAKLANVSDPSPADAIIKAARREKCDLIVMAAHGRRGIARLLLGSETNRVLTHSKIPVLVVR